MRRQPAERGNEVEKSHQSSERAGAQRIRLGGYATANFVRQWGTITARRKLRTKPNKQKKNSYFTPYVTSYLFLLSILY